MRDGLTIIDADRHVIEPLALWPAYLDADLRDRAPYYARPGGDDETLPPLICVDGEPIMNLSASARRAVAAGAAGRREALQAGQDPAGQLADMDRHGIDAAVLFPTFASYLVGIDTMQPRLADAFARAYNDWLREFCAASPRRLVGAGLIARHDPARMVAEARRVASFGWTSVVLRPNPVAGRTLGHPDLEPFWRVCDELSLAVVLHEGTHARVPTAGAERFDTRFAQHACSHPMEQMMAFVALLEGGVLERHPALRVAFLEAGCGWLPHWLWRLDEVEYRHLRHEVEDTVRMAPSRYFRRQCLVGVEPGEPMLADVVRHVGAGSVVFGTDFPHLDHDEAIVDALLHAWRDWPRETLAQVLGGNAARLYRLAV